MLITELRYTGVIFDCVQREWNNVMRDGFRELGLYWMANFRAKHFTNAGAAEYGYAPRQGDAGRLGTHGFKRSYQGRKLRAKGHTRPLTWSGDTEKKTRTARVVAFSTSKESRVEIRINAPTLNLKRPGSAINMREEMTRISPAEKTVLQTVLENYIKGRIPKIPPRPRQARGADGRLIK